MKILITGHTSRVGKILVEHLEKTHEIIKVSRSTGYDLTVREDRLRMIEVAESADCFFNLANIEATQTDLLFEVYQRWQSIGKTGKIISFGTLATAIPFELLRQVSKDTSMVANKLSLEKLHNELAFKGIFGRHVQSVLLRFANFGERTGDRQQEPYTSNEQLLEIIDLILSSTSYISSIDFRSV